MAGLITELSEKYPEMPFTAFCENLKTGWKIQEKSVIGIGLI